MDKIDLIIESAIRFTDSTLLRTPQHADFAVESLTQMRNTLWTCIPHHPALLKLDAYLKDIGRRESPCPLH